MSITRSQIARELMAEGGAPRQGYFLGKIVRKIKDDIIPNELKSPAGLAAAALAVDQFGIPIGGGKKIGCGKNVSGFLGNIFRGGSTPAGTTGDIDRRTGEIFTPNPNDEFGIDGDVYGTSGSKYGNRQDDKGGIVDFFTKKRLGTDKSIANLLL